MGTDMGHIDPRIQGRIENAYALFCFHLNIINPKIYFSHAFFTSHSYIPLF